MDNNSPITLYTSSSSPPSSSQYHHYLMNNSNNNSQSPNLSLNLNDDDDGMEEEPMFEKPLTPSDVGKLNRLVIPKQHAEKYFPLGGDSVAEKGLLLSFEDESGKTWRFRYSYWNSSQSYVLTKGWSRYVKEKRLDAGDVVLFKRHRTDGDRLFIGWRRRAGYGAPGGGGTYPAHRGHAGHYRNNGPGAGAGVAPYQPDCIHAELLSPAQSQTTSLGNINNHNNNANTSSKILRLFGVNMECPYHEHSSAEASAPDGLSHAQGRPHHYYHSVNHFSESQYHDHMDFTFAGDVNPMRDRRG